MGAQYSVAITITEFEPLNPSGTQHQLHSRRLRGTTAHDKLFQPESSASSAEFIVYAFDCDKDEKISDFDLRPWDGDLGLGDDDWFGSAESGFFFDNVFGDAEQATLCFLFPQGTEPTKAAMNGLRVRARDGAYCGRTCDRVDGSLGDYLHRDFGTIELI